MTEEQKIVWDRLKYGVPKRHSMTNIEFAFAKMGRSMGKSTFAAQALGRALRKVNEQSGR